MKEILLFTLLLATLQLSAQTFTNFTTDDGLINNSVNCLAVNADDALWFGTQEGLSFFDGNSWLNYDVNSHPDLVSNTITALAVDQNNDLWIGTDFGVNKFDGTNWTTYTETDGLADDRVKYIKEDAAGQVWIANNDGLSILDAMGTWTSYTMADGLPFGGTNFVTFDADGKAYVGTPLAGVLVFEGTNFTTIDEDDGLLSDKIRSIAIDEAGNKWIGTADGISVFDKNDTFVKHHEFIFELPPPDELNPIEDIQVDAAGRIWVGVYVDYLVTEGGLSVYNGFNWQDFDVADGLIGPVVRRLAVDGADNVWVATSTGISKVSGLPSATIDPLIDQAIVVSPNPASEVLHLQTPEALQGSAFQIFDALGRLVQAGELRSSSWDLELSEQHSGMYYLLLDGLYARKFMIVQP